MKARSEPQGWGCPEPFIDQEVLCLGNTAGGKEEGLGRGTDVPLSLSPRTRRIGPEPRSQSQSIQ
jgi:hypothetical protein